MSIFYSCVKLLASEARVDFVLRYSIRFTTILVKHLGAQLNNIEQQGEKGGDTPLILTLSLPGSKRESINVVVAFESVDKTLVCDHSIESY